MNEMNFLWDLSKVFTENAEPSKFVKAMLEVFRNYYEVSNLKILIWDEQTNSLRDFERSWIFLGQTEQYFYIEKVYKKFFNSTRDTFIKDKNVIYLPLVKKNQVYGILELDFENLFKVDTKDFQMVITIAASQISAIVLNNIMNTQLQISADFHRSMKNIAKIIENQYEFSYIIPLIGEMLDRFVADHLIYVFIKNKDNKFELIWPKSCNEKSILDLLNHIRTDTPYTFTKDGKTGAFPIFNEDDISGAIVAYSNIEKLNNKEIEYLSQLTNQVSITINRADTYAKMLQHATLDALTGLNNRHQMEIRLGQEISTATRKETPLCCIMMDVDYFKKVNDSYGHVAGDCILKGVAKTIMAEIREYDIASRYGGEEFLILLPNTDLREAEFVANRLKQAIEEKYFDIKEANIKGIPSIKITASFGVNKFDKNQKDDFYKNADSALYEAKKRGRNTVVVYH